MLTKSVIMIKMNVFSLGYQDVKQETSGHNHVIYDKQTTCVVANARYKMSLVKHGHFGLTSEVTADICALPNTQDIGAYTAFIDKWGTVRSQL